MGNRVGHLIAAVCLSAVGILTAPGSIQLLRTTYAAPSLSEQDTPYITTSLPVTPTLEPRAYLPLVMQNFCVPISIPTDAKLFGVVFFDYNGDGSQQPSELGIVGASIFVGSQSTSSQCNGIYYFRDLPDGCHNLTMSATAFGFISISRSDFNTIGTPVAVTVSGKAEHNIGLMQGFLTLPFSEDTDFQRGDSPFGQDSLFDLDNLDGTAMAYNAITHPCNVGLFPCVKDGHAGIDFGVKGNTILLAAAPGTVVAVYEVPGEHPVGKVIVDTGIEVTIPLVYRNGTVQSETQNLCIQYAHVISPTVGVGGRVVRGQQLGLVDPWGAGPHLHFQPHGYIDRYDERAFTSIDPYMATQEVLDTLPDLQDIAEHLSDADSVTIPSNYLQQGFNGLWTVANSPNFPGEQ